jgi:putative hemolysin
MPNPAAVYCEQQGGSVNIVKDAEGNESGMCKLADGTEVDEWEYYRANNPESET